MTGPRPHVGPVSADPVVRAVLVLAALLAALLAGPALFGLAPRADAAPVSATAPLAQAPAPVAPAGPTGPGGTAGGDSSVSVKVGELGKPSDSIVVLLVVTVLSVAPALLLMCTSFTKVFVVLGIARNALGLSNVPPNQVLAGLALFLSLFIMGPTASKINSDGVQPYLHGQKSQSLAWQDGVKPLHDFMARQTRPEEIALFTKVAQAPRPASPDAVPLTTLIPAFVLSELRAAMIIGFVVYIPFLIIDMVVSASLMSLGMMMLPPVTVSLPFKMLLFVLANGWGLIISALVASYR
jgi:flagellar biosynthetic protein FliP